MIAAAKRYYAIMTGIAEAPRGLAVSYPAKYDSIFESVSVRYRHRSLDRSTKEISDLRRSLAPHFSKVLILIIVHDLTTKETAERLFSKADSKTEAMALERLRGASDASGCGKVSPVF